MSTEKQAATQERVVAALDGISGLEVDAVGTGAREHLGEVDAPEGAEEADALRALRCLPAKGGLSSPSQVPSSQQQP